MGLTSWENAPNGKIIKSDVFVAYTLKMSYKTDYKIEGFFEYVVPPLEGFWWQDDVDGVDYTDKSTFNWISVIRLPDFITEKDFNWAVETATKKKKQDCSSAEVSPLLILPKGLIINIIFKGDCCLRKNNTLEIVA